MAAQESGRARMALDNVTVIITTHNRPFFLLRLLRSLDAYNFYAPVIILDSSAEKSSLPQIHEIVGRRGIQWLRFDPGQGQAVKLFEAAPRIKTPYVVLCADDDLMVFPFLKTATDYLDRHSDYSVVHGESIMFQISGDAGKRVLKNISDYPQRDLAQDTPAQRLVDHLDNYTPLAYSVQRIADFQQIMSLWHAAGCEPTIFTELFTSSASLILGKAKKIGRLFYLRQKDLTTEIEKPFVGRDFFDWFTREDFHREYQAFSRYLFGFIMEKQKLTRDEAELVVRRAFGGFVRGRFLTRRHLFEKNYSWDARLQGIGRFREGIKARARGGVRQMVYWYGKYIGSKGLVDFLTPFSSYYDDFKPLHKLILETK